MITIKPLTHVQLSHRAFQVATAKSGDTVAVSRLGAGSLISADQHSVAPFDVHFEVRNVSIAANASLIAITGSHDIAVISTPTLKIVTRLSECFESSCFSSDGLLWTCTRRDSQTEIFEVWEAPNWTKIAGAKVTDPFGDSYFWLVPHPYTNCVVAWAAAGQDGQSLFWAHLDGPTIRIDRFSDLDDEALPSFSPTGHEFLVVSLNELYCYAYPRGPLKARMQWPSEYGRDMMGDFVYYVNDHLALLSSTYGRLFLVDVETMSIEDEIVIHGHEPTTRVSRTGSRWRGDPELFGKQDPEPASDLSLLLPLPPGRFLSVHDESGSDPDQRQDQLLTWQVP